MSRARGRMSRARNEGRGKGGTRDEGREGREMILETEELGERRMSGDGRAEEEPRRWKREKMEKLREAKPP